MAYFIAISMALIAYSCISTGFVLQKMGIRWMGWKGKRDRTFYKNLGLWVSGFVIMNIYGVPSAIALKQLPPHIVAAFAGWGIVVLVFLSHFLLKEKLYKKDALFSFLIVAGICLLNLFEKPAPAGGVHLTGMIALCLPAVVLFIPGFLKTVSARIKTVLFASVSGIAAGLMVISLSLLVMEYQYNVALYFNSPYLYLYTGSALLSFIALQLACKNGPMMIIGPVQYSSNIIYPMLAVLLVFNHPLHIIQFFAIGLVVFSVSSILKKR